MAAQSFPPGAAPVVLLIRPAAQSARFADSLLESSAGLRVVKAPLIAPVFLDPVLPVKSWAGIILSSETGAKAAGRMKPLLPDFAFCVGDRTAQAARLAGFAPHSAQGDAEAMLALILSHPKVPLLHLRGRETQGDLAKRLSANGIQTDEAVVYAQEAQPLTAEAIALLQTTNSVVVPLFSPRSAEIFGAECQRITATARLCVIAISRAVADVACPWSDKVIVAAQPTAESMAEAVIQHLAAGQDA